MCDFHHVGVLSTFSNIPAAAAARIARCSQLSSPRPGQVVWWFVRAGILNRPSRTKSHPAGSHSPTSSQAGRRVGPAI
jgi:hypothetical protein